MKRRELASLLNAALVWSERSGASRIRDAALPRAKPARDAAVYTCKKHGKVIGARLLRGSIGGCSRKVNRHW